jgi:hypothetical protein
MDNFFEILIYIVVFGFVILANLKKSKKQAQTQHEVEFEPVGETSGDFYAAETEASKPYVAYEPSKVPDVKARILAKLHAKKQVEMEKKTSTPAGVSNIRYTEIKSPSKCADNQRKKKFDFRKAVVYSTIIERPYN